MSDGDHRARGLRGNLHGQEKRAVEEHQFKREANRRDWLKLGLAVLVVAVGGLAELHRQTAATKQGELDRVREELNQLTVSIEPLRIEMGPDTGSGGNSSSKSRAIATDPDRGGGNSPTHDSRSKQSCSECGGSRIRLMYDGKFEWEEDCPACF